MIAVDANISIYAHQFESELHEAATARLTALGDGPEGRAPPTSCVVEVMRVAAHNRVFSPQPTVAEGAAVALLQAQSQRK